MAGSKGIAGSAVLIGAAGLYFVYAGIKDVELIPGLRAIMRGQVPEGKPHAPFSPTDPAKYGVTATSSFIPQTIGPVKLVTVNGIRVNVSIAANLSRMISAAKGDGITLRGSGYRSSLEQANLRREHCCKDPNSSKCSCGPDTAPVGSSMHERGEAIDFRVASGRAIKASDPEYRWLKANANKYGFFNLPSETWHWSIKGK